MRATVRRRQAEQAMRMLRDTVVSLAEIAQAAGFCDQSHMHRVIRSLGGRTPVQVRAEAATLAAAIPA